MKDPTYNKEEINNNPVWQLAFDMSEVMNDNAPLGWYKYVPHAECLLNLYKIEKKA